MLQANIICSGVRNRNYKVRDGKRVRVVNVQPSGRTIVMAGHGAGVRTQPSRRGTTVSRDHRPAGRNMHFQNHTVTGTHPRTSVVANPNTHVTSRDEEYCLLCCMNIAVCVAICS